jgi:hypothetical protein
MQPDPAELTRAGLLHGNRCARSARHPGRGRRVLPDLVQRAPRPGRPGHQDDLARARLSGLGSALTTGTGSGPVWVWVCAKALEDDIKAWIDTWNENPRP